jgi:hypothetical protein
MYSPWKDLVMKTLPPLQAYLYLFIPDTENSNEFVSNEETILITTPSKLCKPDFW